MSTTSIQQLVSDTRFLSEAHLEILLKCLVGVSEVKDDCSAENGKETPVFLSKNIFDINSQTIAKCRMLFLDCSKSLKSPLSFSSATIAWLEMVLVEISLRNRDRFQTFWPILKHHYIRVLSGSQASLSYITERRVLGVLKICTRMISRDHFSGTILEVLGRIFARPAASPTSPVMSPSGSSKLALPASSVAAATAEGAADDEDGYTLTRPPYPPMSAQLLVQLSNQVRICCNFSPFRLQVNDSLLSKFSRSLLRCGGY
jgi:hypothetical protein